MLEELKCKTKKEYFLTRKLKKKANMIQYEQCKFQIKLELKNHWAFGNQSILISHDFIKLILYFKLNKVSFIEYNQW